jgi:transcriptional regulator with XRE-family HTH domain
MGLRQERKAAKLSQHGLARLSTVNQGLISRLESGELLNPTIGTLDKLASALQRLGRKISPMDLVPRRQPVLIKGARSLRRGKGAA